MRIIIAGSRGFYDYKKLKHESIRIIKELEQEGYNTKRSSVEIISGTAIGADQLGEGFAKEFELGLKRFPADWNLGKKAGYIRNSQMSKYAKQDSELGVLIAFWDGCSNGTKHMIDLANKDELRVYVIRF